MPTTNRADYRHEREDDIQLLGERVYLSLNSENLRRWPKQWRKKNQERRAQAITMKAGLAQLIATERWLEEWDERH